MRIKSVDIQNFRAFQEPFHMELGKYITAISGLNGIGKSTILAILSNSSEIKPKQTHKQEEIFGNLYNGDSFRGDFTDIIMYDPKKDTPGPNKAAVTFIDFLNNKNDSKTIKFRATVQNGKMSKDVYRKRVINGDTYYEKSKKEKSYNRYRLIPTKEKDGWQSSAKMEWPSYYLGLSRIFPIGENNTATTKRLPDDISKRIVNKHAEIMHENFDTDKATLESVNVNGLTFNKSGIETDDYSATSNSSGQDNLAQILQAVLSFEKLKEEMPTTYQGGLLTIDELDATLHPAAQNKLLHWLYLKAKELDLQIVFTTHSITLLEFVSHKTKEKGVNPGDIEIAYLRQDPENTGQILARINPNAMFFRNALKDTYTKPMHFSQRINVLTEDYVSRVFLDKLIRYSKHLDLLQLNVLQIDISWSHLVTLITSDPEQFSYFITILDPDCSIDPKLTQLRDLLIRGESNIEVNNPNSNLFILPGNNSVEKMLWLFLNDMKANDDFFAIPVIDNYGWTKEHALKDGPTSKIYDGQKDNNKFKHWYQDNYQFMTILMDQWIKTHASEVTEFTDNLYQAFRRIQSIQKK